MFLLPALACACQHGAPGIFDPWRRAMARRDLEQGEQRRAAGDTVGAEAAFRSAAQRDPRSAVNHARLAEALMARGDAAGAAAAWADAVRSDPRDFDVALRLADALYMHASTSARSGRAYAVALRAYRNARALRPDDERALLGQARCHNVRGEHRQARDLLVSRAQRGEANPAAQVELGEAWLGLGEAERASAVFEGVLSADDGNTAAHWGLARAYLARLDPASGLNAPGAQENGDSPSWTIDRLHLERAAVHLRRVVEAWPDHAEARLALRAVDGDSGLAAADAVNGEP